MSDSAFVGQPTSAAGQDRKQSSSSGGDDKKNIHQTDPAIVQVGMGSKGNEGESATATAAKELAYDVNEINDPKLDVISDIASSTPEQQDSDGVLLSDDIGSGETSLSDSESTTNHFTQREENPTLPDTVTVLEGPNNGKVYLVGTAHFSEQSQLDVEETIRKTQPNVVLLELCNSRLSILSLDEKTIMEETKSMNLEKVRQSIKEQGLVQGVMYLLLLNLSGHLTKELGMAPGGEFRRAYREAKRVPGCIVVLGDRPVHITLQRAISSLSLWQKLRLGCSILFSKEPISKEEVEKCKQRDLLEEMLAEITGEFPALSEVFVGERDKYLAYSLYLAASSVSDVHMPNGLLPQTVVGVVGIGHVPGIVRHWGTVKDEDIPPLCALKQQSLTTTIVLKSIKYSVSGLLILGVYKFILPSTVTELCSDLAGRAWANLQRTINK